VQAIEVIAQVRGIQSVAAHAVSTLGIPG
jgi:hypothetical protein